MEARLHFALAIVCALVTVGVLFFVFLALWPWLPDIGVVLYIAFCIGSALGTFELYSLVRHRHLLRVHKLSTAEANAQRAWLHAQVIDAAGIAAYVNEHGNLYNMSAYEEQAKVFPVNPQEITADLAAEVKRLHAAGTSEATLAGQFSISRYQVRALLGKPRSSKKEEKP